MGSMGVDVGSYLWGRCGVHVEAMYWVKRKPKKDKRRMRRSKIRKEGSGEKQEKFCAGTN